MPTSYNDNIILIQALRKGEEDAFAFLIDTYHKPLFIYALSLSKDHNAAEDIVQNTFLKIWEYRKKLRTDSFIKNLLYKTTHNNFISHYRKEKNIYPINDIYIEAVNDTVENDNTELLNRKIAIVNKGIDKLPKKCKQIFLLSKQEGLSNKEIAEHLNISVKTVEGQITKAYRLLRHLIGDKIKEVLLIIFQPIKN